VPGFTFVGREAEVAAFRDILERPQGELLAVTGPDGTGKSHLLRRLRGEAESHEQHFVQLAALGALPDADVRVYAVLCALEAAHRQDAAATAAGEPVAGGGRLCLVPSPRDFFTHLIDHDARPAEHKLGSVLAAASVHLPDAARFVLLVDLGRAEDDDAFPLEFLARRLPDKVKLVVAAREVPESVRRLPNATILGPLPPLGEADVARLMEFNLPRQPEARRLAGAALASFGGHPLLTDLAGKLVAAVANPATALASLPATADGMCRQLLARLGDEQRAVVECIAAVPSGLDLAALRTLLGLSEADLRRVLFTDDVRNIIITHRTRRGTEARVFHECFGDLFRADKLHAAALHKRVAAHFLAAATSDPHDVEALGAHSYHIRLAGDRAQFMRDFAQTLPAKEHLGLLRLLVAEYKLLLVWCGNLGTGPLARTACMASLGRLYQRLGQCDDALRVLRDALETCQRADDQAGVAQQLVNLASVLLDAGRHAEALEHIQRAIALSEAQGDKATLAASLSALGDAHQRLAHPDKALPLYQRALVLCQELKDHAGAARQLTRLGALLRSTAPHAARDAYRQAWRLHNRLGAAADEVADLCNLGTVYQQLGELDMAIVSLQEAIKLDRTAGDRNAEVEHLRTLADLHLAHRQPEEAMNHLLESIRLAQSYGNPAAEAAGLIALARVSHASGETANARQLLEEAAALAAKIGAPDIEAQAQAVLAELTGPSAAQAEAPPEPQEPIEPEAPTRPEAPTEPEAPTTPASHAADAPQSTQPQPEAPEATRTAANPSATTAAEPTRASQPAEDGEAAELRRRLDEALQRIAELEAEVARYKKIVKALREVMGQ